ncbi:MAG: leucine-rich repeat domain-containing protein, partial [Cyanobacteriota bacterium]
MSEPQQIKPTTFNSFADWCLHKNSLSEAARHTVEVLLEEAGTSDCNKAEWILLNCTMLNLSDNEITDLSPLSGLTNLTQLYLTGNEITDLSPLSGLTNLTQLYLNYNQINDLSPLSGLTNLTQMYLDNNQITDLSPFSRLTNLTQMDLDNNQITDLSPLSRLTNLTQLDLNSNQITDLSPLSGLINLTQLTLYNNQITDLSPLSGLTNLIELTLSNNQITDLSPLSGLTKLTELKLTHLTQFRLENNPFYNLTLVPSLLQKQRSLLTKRSDFQKAKKAIKSAYATIGKEEPEVLFFRSPHAGCTQLFNLLKLDNTPEEQTFGQMKSLIVWGESLSKQLQGILKGLSCQGLWKYIWFEIASQHIPEQEAGDEEAWWELYKLINYSPELIGADSSSFDADDFYPVTPTEIFKQIYATEFYVSSLGVTLDQKTREAFDCLNQLFEHCGLIFPFEKVCVVCDRP